MVARKLVTIVHVTDDAGRVHAFGPEDTLPAWARKAITNPKAFGGDEEDERQPDAKVLPAPAPEKAPEKSGS
jgi:hypothetical protein